MRKEPDAENEILFHVVNTIDQSWYHVDRWYRLWTCGCKDQINTSICLTIDQQLADEGEFRELGRKIAERRKQLGLKPGEELN